MTSSLTCDAKFTCIFTNCGIFNEGEGRGAILGILMWKLALFFSGKNSSVKGIFKMTSSLNISVPLQIFIQCWLFGNEEYLWSYVTTLSLVFTVFRAAEVTCIYFADSATHPLLHCCTLLHRVARSHTRSKITFH